MTTRWKHFYPRSPCGERPARLPLDGPAIQISIHALLAESDCYAVFCHFGGTNFYPRSPCGERHSRQYICPQNRKISIHALLAESDPVAWRRSPSMRHFYPRSPCGERPVSSRKLPSSCRLFLSTLSLRRATAKVHKTVGYFCAYETIFLEIASSC